MDGTQMDRWKLDDQKMNTGCHHMNRWKSDNKIDIRWTNEHNKMKTWKSDEHQTNIRWTLDERKKNIRWTEKTLDEWYKN